MVDTRVEVRVSTLELLMVIEFPDVFPEGLPNVPYVRHVGFRINLVPGATPIHKMSYLLAPL